VSIRDFRHGSPMPRILGDPAGGGKVGRNLLARKGRLNWKSMTWNFGKLEIEKSEA
jgi:hypothetical protein